MCFVSTCSVGLANVPNPLTVYYTARILFLRSLLNDSREKIGDKLTDSAAGTPVLVSPTFTVDSRGKLSKFGSTGSKRGPGFKCIECGVRKRTREEMVLHQARDHLTLTTEQKVPVILIRLGPFRGITIGI